MMMMDMLSFWDDAMEKLCFGKGIFQRFDMGLSVPRGIFQGYGRDFPVTSGRFGRLCREHLGILGNCRGILTGIFQGYRGFGRDFRDVSVPRGIRDHPNKCICSYKCVSCIFKQVLFPESSPLSLKNPRSISRQGCIVRRVI